MMFRYSNISTAYTCLKRFDLEINKGIKAEKESPVMNFGTAMHLAIATYLETKDYDYSLDMLNTYWNSCSALDFTMERDGHATLMDKGKIFLDRFVRLQAKHYTPKFIETNINFMLMDYSFTGTPDFIGEYKGIPSVVDFKTSASRYDKRKIVVNEQMYLYALAAEQTLNYKVEQLVYTVLIKNPEPSIQQIAIPLDREIMKRNIDNVAMMCKDLSSRTEFPGNKNSCLYCPHYTRCFL